MYGGTTQSYILLYVCSIYAVVNILQLWVKVFVRVCICVRPYVYLFTNCMCGKNWNCYLCFNTFCWHLKKTIHPIKLFNTWIKKVCFGNEKTKTKKKKILERKTKALARMIGQLDVKTRSATSMKTNCKKVKWKEKQNRKKWLNKPEGNKIKTHVNCCKSG